MRKYIIITVLSVIFFLSLLLNLRLYREKRAQNYVVEVVDGDTFQLKSGKRVRLLGVDAPEYNRCGGKEARDRLKQLISNKPVVLKEEQQETFGRTLALTYVDSKLMNEIILKEGWARPDYRKNSQRERLTAAFHFAKDHQLGIFSSACRIDQSVNSLTGELDNCLIKGNIDKNTYKKYYHLPSCKHYKEIIIEKDIGEQYFCSENEASSAGFTKASGCP